MCHDRTIQVIQHRTVLQPQGLDHLYRAIVAHRAGLPRSEEHTSELQSRLHLVCRLLLEKKKTTSHLRYHHDIVNCIYCVSDDENQSRRLSPYEATANSFTGYSRGYFALHHRATHKASDL